MTPKYFTDSLSFKGFLFINKLISRVGFLWLFLNNNTLVFAIFNEILLAQSQVKRFSKSKFMFHSMLSNLIRSQNKLYLYHQQRVKFD